MTSNDVEGRKWFRRALIALCIAGYAMILVPQEWRDGVFSPELDIISADVIKPLTIVDERCAVIKIIGLKGGPVTWHDCTKTFSDGTKFRRIGDVKP